MALLRFLAGWALAREMDYFTGWLKTKKYWTEVKIFSLIAGVEIWAAVYGGHMEDLGTILPHQNFCPFFVYQCRYCDKWSSLVRNHLVDGLNEKSSKEPENLKILKFFQLHFICFRKYYMKIHRQLTRPTVPFYTTSPQASIRCLALLSNILSHHLSVTS